MGDSCTASSNLLGIVGAILGVDFKVVALKGTRSMQEFSFCLLSSLLPSTFLSHLLDKTLSDGHGVVLAHV